MGEISKCFKIASAPLKESETHSIASIASIASELRNFVNFGLEYWGSDQMGVNKTRRFLLEWLSFTCRYIPVGVLEVLPQRINEKPPPFVR